MNNIVSLVKNEVLEEIDNYKKNASDHYDFWEEHIKYVYEESRLLAKKYNANIKIVSLGALLHDIALIKKVGDRSDHHINGAILGKEILEKYTNDKDLIDKVCGCIYNHRSSKNATNIEELCVGDADILAHFDNIPMLFNSAFNRHKLNLIDAKEWIRKVFEKDYNDLSKETKKVFKDKYKEIYNVIFHK